MEVTPAEAEKIVSQVQTAHRLLAAYYQRLLGRLDAIGTQFGLGFMEWDTLETDRPCRSSTQPSTKWVWDFLPLYAFSCTYRRSSGKRVRRGDVVLAFEIYTDGAFEESERKKARITRCPDPFTLPYGEGYVVAYVYRYVSETQRLWDKAWCDASEPDASAGGWTDLGQGFVGCTKRIPLSDILSDPEGVMQMLGQVIDEPAELVAEVP